MKADLEVTVTVEAQALDYTIMVPPTDSSWTGELFTHKTSLTFTVGGDPCVTPTLTTLIVPTVGPSWINIGD